MKIIAVVLALASIAVAGDLPNAPSATPRHPEEVSRKVVVDQTGPRFFEFRKSWQDPPLATNKQFLNSKVMWATEGYSWGVTIVACRAEGTCKGEIPAQLAVTALGSYVGYRLFSPLFLLMHPIAVTGYWLERPWHK